MSGTCRDNCQQAYEYVKRQLTEHPNQVNQTWAQHCRDALSYSGRALAAGGALFLHAIFPCLFQRWGGKQIEQLHTIIQEKRREHDPNLNHPLVQSVHEDDE